MTSQPKISVASRAHRALRELKRFTFATNENAGGCLNLDRVGELNGDLVGVYENPSGVEPKQIVVTDQALGCVGTDRTRWIPFEDIAETSGPQDKQTADEIVVVLRSGIRTHVRIAGGDDRFRDIFSFVRFLDRVLEDRSASS